MESELINNLDKLHTTELGEIRIRKNLGIDVENVVDYLGSLICKSNALITRKGKNFYVEVGNKLLTINACSYTIITAYKI